MSLELSMGLVVGFTLLGIASGVPIGYIFGIGCLIFMVMIGDIDYITRLVPDSFKMLQGFAFLALPLYMMVGSLMLTTSLTSRLFDFLYVILGKARAAFGGALVSFVAVFGAITGSASATIGAIGPLVIPEGAKYGYHKEYTTGLVACASLVAMLIPPSLSMIVFGVAGHLSIPLLFLATAIPGLLSAMFFIGLNFFLTRRGELTRLEQPPVTSDTKKELTSGGRREVWGKAGAAWPVLVLPAIILGGIYSGIFTPTEAAVVAVVWIMLYKLVASAVSAIIRKSISLFGTGLNDLARGFLEAAKPIGAIGTICFFMFALSRAFVFAGIPAMILRVLTTAIPTPGLFLLSVNVLLLLMGMIMDDMSCCILAGVILLPVAKHFGINPFHFGAIVGVNTGLGNLTPPVAPNLYLAAGVGNVQVKLFPPNRYVKTVLYLLLFGQLIVLILTTYIPQVSLFLPNLWLGTR